MRLSREVVRRRVIPPLFENDTPFSLTLRFLTRAAGRPRLPLPAGCADPSHVSPRPVNRLRPKVTIMHPGAREHQIRDNFYYREGIKREGIKNLGANRRSISPYR